MQLSDFSFDLPDDLIAQYPHQQRDGSRLMILDRGALSVDVGRFADLSQYFQAGDLLVVNDTRVIPARLLGYKESGGRIEVFLSRQMPLPGTVWQCLTRSSKTPRPGTRLFFDNNLRGVVLEGDQPPHRLVRFEFEGDFFETLERVGQVPLPPYIKRSADDDDRERYQTVFGAKPGAVAAPTAGLHFTRKTFDELQRIGVEVQALTLHVGLGTFLPVRVENVLEHRMHAEHFHVSHETAAAVNQARSEGRRIFALGTTTTRVLEYALDGNGRLKAGEGASDLFIYPGFEFRMVDALITNFHLPESTLLMLVSAFAGRDFVLKAYRQAVAERFRFFSYGDCMLIL